MRAWISSSILALALVTTSASADVIRFDYQGSCDNLLWLQCNNLGLDDGASVAGFLETVDGLDGDNVLLGDELSDFGFNFGLVSINPSTHVASGGLVLNADGSGFGGFIGEGMFFTGANSGAVTGSINLGFFNLSGWVASREVTETYRCWRFGVGWTTCERTRTVKGGGPGEYTRVSEPGTLALLGSGLLALWFAMRRRRPA